MENKISLGAILAAVFLFFLPWVDFQCSNRTILTQSGIQTAYGGASVDESIEALGEGKNSGNKDQSMKKLSPAYLTAIALVCLLTAAYFCIKDYRGSEENLSPGTVVFSSAALLLLVAQLSLGFPFEREFRASMKESTSTTSSDPDDPFADMGKVLAVQFEVKYTTPLYCELAALAIPLLLIGKRRLDSSKNNTSPLK